MIRRRSFLTHFGGAITAGAATVGAAGLGQYQAARHSQDEWFDQLPGRHRFIFDSTTAQGFGEAMIFANNFLEANKNDYGLKDNDAAVVIVARHFSTPYAYSDAIWAKYGSIFTKFTNLNDPKTKQAPKVNLYAASGYGTTLPNFGVTLDALEKRGVHFAVCKMATAFLAGQIAGEVKGDATKINDELVASIGTNSRMVPAGIAAVNRAQEHGYTFVSAG